MNSETIITVIIVAIIATALGFFIGRVKAVKAENELALSQQQLNTYETQSTGLQVKLGDVNGQLENLQTSLSDIEQANATLTANLYAEQQQLTDKKQQLETAQDDVKQERLKTETVEAERNKANEELAELRTANEKQEEHHKEQTDQYDEQKKVFKTEFENLANKIFDEKGKAFTDTNKTSIDAMLKPFKNQIEGFQKRINEVHDESLKGNTNLSAEIKSVLEIGLKMSDEANNLTSALKGDSQKRGAWGEAQLERTLEMSGLIEDAHFEKQASFKDKEGKRKQTDFIIKLPDDKSMIIDSKVSLVAYDAAVSASTPEEYELAMNEHIKAVKSHIDDLASKDYTNLIGMRSPSFVLMFMPIEPAYIDALKNKKDLFNYGYDKGIVLVSHTTLIPILRTVANLWMMERSNAEAREISDKAGDIYNQVCVVAERLQKLGGSLTALSNHYNSTVTAVVGQQGLHGKVERFTQLSSKVSKTMPAIEPTHLDFETERLLLVAEPIIEDDLGENNELDETTKVADTTNTTNTLEEAGS